MSQSATAGGDSCRRPSASSALPAVVTAKPSDSNQRASKLRTLFSSSTIRTLCAARSKVAAAGSSAWSSVVSRRHHASTITRCRGDA
jgi:hypothetical protein